MVLLLSHSIIYITLGIFFQLLVEIKSQTAAPLSLRAAHTTTLINDKLYILGGTIPGISKSPKETFLYIDFSTPFNTNEIQWFDLSKNNIVPAHFQASASKGGANNSTLFLFGGKYLIDETMALVYSFDTQSNLWKIQEITGIAPIRRQGVTSVIDYNGLMYLFSGLSGTLQNSNLNYENDMIILDTINLSWKKGSSINAPNPGILFGAVLLPNNNIIYMGM
jgi:hypothetical protein